MRRWPCWPGPYSRRLTGLLGRPKTFSPMRRSSLYLALVRFDMSYLQFALSHVPGPRHQLAQAQDATTASPGVRDQLRSGAPSRARRLMVKVRRGQAAGSRLRIAAAPALAAARGDLDRITASRIRRLEASLWCALPCTSQSDSGMQTLLRPHVRRDFRLLTATGNRVVESQRQARPPAALAAAASSRLKILHIRTAMA